MQPVALLRQMGRRLWRDRVDWRYDTDTGGLIAAADLETGSPDAAASYCYRPALGWVTRHFLRQLPSGDLSRFSFVDFGSGKGRALLVASEFAFGQIVGVEFSVPLHDIAQANIARLPRAQNRDGRVRSVHQDAAAFVLPPTDLVCYFYNPFGPPVLDAVVDRIAAHARSGFDVLVIYINPRHRDAFERDGRFEAVYAHEKGLLLRRRRRRSARATRDDEDADQMAARDRDRAPRRSRAAGPLTLVIWVSLLAAATILAVSVIDPALLGIAV